MFDEATEKVIRGAYALEDLNTEDLPRKLTEAYAQVIAARLRIAGGADARLGKDWSQLERTLGALGAAYEVIALAAPSESGYRANTAFVAASAHHARMRTQAVTGASAAMRQFDRWSVSPTISAALLYAVGDHHADAAEVGRDLIHDEPSTLEDFIEDSIGRICIARQEHLQIIATRTINKLDNEYSIDDQAQSNLLVSLMRGIADTSRHLLGETGLNPLGHFDWVISVTEEPSLASPPMGSPVWGGFLAPGTRHLALLLRSACAALMRVAVAGLPAPPHVPPDEWRRFLRHYTNHRPLLWRNHRDLLDAGFLTPGVSWILSYPTGAGKSAISELRAAAEILRGRRVIYIAPTKALVTQVRRQLAAVLRPISGKRVESFATEFGEKIEDYDVGVMTPEACLVLASTSPEQLENVGLIIFDECHLLSGVPEGESGLPTRRALDANLAVIDLAQKCSSADFILLSAMISNADEIACWIAKLTGRDCVPRTDEWKPTRQIRGILAYPHREMEAAKLQAAETQRVGGSPSDATQFYQLTPWGVFCHRQAWDPQATYKAIPMLSSKVPLKINKRWTPTANRNVVAARLASAFIKSGMRPLVFVQDIKGTGAVASSIEDELKDEELQNHIAAPHLVALAELELGSKAAVYDASGLVGRHHALLLPPEREAMEEGFRDKDGFVGFVATPTLAQGMNFPAEIVIIAGDNRWEDDDEGGHPVVLPVAEILNAAGRAGRAGMFAQGLVFLIPAMNVFSIRRSDKKIIFDGLSHASALLGRPDQCLKVTDPITQAMDVASAGGDLPDVCSYLLSRCQHGRDGDEPTRRLLTSSMRYTLAENTEQALELDNIVRETMRLASTLSVTDQEFTASDEMARSLGIPAASLMHLMAALPPSRQIATMGTLAWTAWLCRYLVEFPVQLTHLVHIHASGLYRIFRKRDDEDVEARLARIARGVEAVLPSWILGKPLSEIEPLLHTHSGRKQKSKTLDLSRRFHNESAAALGGLGHLVRRLVLIREDEQEHPAPTPLALETLGGCIAAGVDSPAKLALAQILSSQIHTTRVDIHEKFNNISGVLGLPTLSSRMRELRQEVAAAAKAAGLLGS